MLPKKIFFAGVPGSRWSSIAQIIESMPGFNISDRTDQRCYANDKFSGHLGAYFGNGMELEPNLDDQYINQAWDDDRGCKLIKSHDWAYCLDDIKNKFPDDWILLVYRPDLVSYAWWHEAGGFNITYPNYQAYQSSQGMMASIMEQNKLILDFAYRQSLSWHYFSAQWCYENLGHAPEISQNYNDILVTLIK